MSRSATPSTRRKATLFCAACGHESGPDGDWIDRQEHGETLICPDCGTVVVAQPSFGVPA